MTQIHPRDASLSISDETSKDVKLVNFRLRPGDDTSCLNLYQPRNPKIVAPPESFIRDNRFTFQNSLAAEQRRERQPVATPESSI